MAKIKLTKSAVDAAQPQTEAVELRDTLVPGFLCKITPAGRKVFMLQYRTNAGERRKPSLGLYGELTVEQARSLAQEWLAQVRRGGDPAAEKAVARQAPHGQGATTHPTVSRSAGIASNRSAIGPPRCHARCPWTASCLSRCRPKLPNSLRSAATYRRAFRCSSEWAPCHRRRCASRQGSFASTACLRPPCCRPTGWAARCNPGSSAAVLHLANCSC
ncbi:MAG: integrase [Caballeronia mineralivorans]|jgi:hypothetical protein|nr:integrase [Caballeronia mineralivorans]